MVNWGSGEVGEDNRSENPGVVRRGAMAPHWPSNRFYLFPVTSGVLRPESIWYTLPNWQWVVPTRHVFFYVGTLTLLPKTLLPGHYLHFDYSELIPDILIIQNYTC